MNPLLAPAVFGEKRDVEVGVKQSSSESWNGRESLHGDRPGCLQEAATGRDSEPAGASPFFAQPEMGSVRFRVQTMGRRPLPSAARVRPGAHSARHQDSRNNLTPCRMAWHFVSAGAHAPHSDQTLGPTPTRGSSHSARRLRSLASLCSSVALDSIIHSDGWRGYNGLVDMGYQKHLRVHHGRNEGSR